MKIADTSLKTKEAVERHIDASLRAYCFRGLSRGRDRLARDLEEDALPRTASAVCKFAGLVLQANWIGAKCDGVDFGGMPERLDNILLQVWAGHQKYTEEIATSILYEASQDRSLASLVCDPDAIEKWKDLLELRRGGRFRYFDEKSQGLDIPDLFIRLLKALPILNCKIHSGSFVFDSNRKISTFPFISTSDQVDNPLYFYAIEHMDQGVKLRFEDPFSSYSEWVCPETATPEHETIRSIDGALGLQQVQEGILYLFGDEYKHIRKLVIAITETARKYRHVEAALQEVIEEFAKEYDSEIKSKTDHDNCVTLLLADHGPLLIIRELCGRISGLHETYFDHMARGEQTKIAEMKESYEKMYRARAESIERMAADDWRKDQMRKKAKLDASAYAVLEASGLKLQPRQDVEPIDMTIKTVERLLDRLSRPLVKDETIIYAGRTINVISERTLRFLISFYSGVSALYRSRGRKDDHNGESDDIFTAGFRKGYAAVHKESVRLLIERFQKMASERDQKWMEAMLGRKAICDSGIFKGITDKWTKKGMNNRVKHDSDKPEVSLSQMVELVEDTLNVLRFLRNGTRNQVKDYTLEPIYPAVISFYEARRKRDGLMICNYEINSFGDKDESGEYRRIQILTTRQYSPNEDYFCIPRSDQSTHNWWLDPFLIRCSSVHQLIPNEDKERYVPE